MCAGLTSDDAAVRKVSGHRRVPCIPPLLLGCVCVQTAANAWSVWEGSTSKLLFDRDFLARFADDEFADVFSRIEVSSPLPAHLPVCLCTCAYVAVCVCPPQCHYFTNKGFFDSEDYLLRNVDKIRHIPTVIVQGRYDVVCPIYTAHDLHKVTHTLPLLTVTLGLRVFAHAMCVVVCIRLRRHIALCAPAGVPRGGVHRGAGRRPQRVW